LSRYRFIKNEIIRPFLLYKVHGAKGQEYDRVYIDPDKAALYIEISKG
jgi:hypothetical protein